MPSHPHLPRLPSPHSAVPPRSPPFLVSPRFPPFPPFPPVLPLAFVHPGINKAKERQDDLWCLNLETGAWAEVAVPNSNSGIPTARTFSTMTGATTNGAITIHGGYDGKIRFGDCHRIQVCSAAVSREVDMEAVNAQWEASDTAESLCLFFDMCAAKPWIFEKKALVAMAKAKRAAVVATGAWTREVAHSFGAAIKSAKA